jgi:hypothetical protein
MFLNSGCLFLVCHFPFRARKHEAFDYGRGNLVSDGLLELSFVAIFQLVPGSKTLALRLPTAPSGRILKANLSIRQITELYSLGAGQRRNRRFPQSHGNAQILQSGVQPHFRSLD